MPVFTIETPAGVRLNIEAENEDAALYGAQQWHAQNASAKDNSTPSGSDPTAPLRHGYASAVSGVGETLKQFSPFQDTAEALKKHGANAEPSNYKSEPIVDKEGFHAGNIPKALGEATPAAAATVLAMRMAAKRLGPIGALLSGAGTYAATQLGRRADERAATRTGDENAEPSTTDKVITGATMVPEALINAIAGRRFLPGAGKVSSVGAKGVLDSAKQLGTTAAVEGGTSGLQSGIEQVGRTVGTPGGVKVDPLEAANQAVTGTMVGGALGAPKAVRDATSSVKFRNIDPKAARDVANDIQAAADGDIGKPKVGFQSVADVETNYKTDLTSAARDLRRTAVVGTEADGVLKRAGLGRKLTDADIETLDNVAPGTQAGDAVVTLARKINTLARLKATGDYSPSEGKFIGGAGRTIEKSIGFIGNPVKGAAYGALGAAGLAHVGMLAPSMPFLGGAAGVYAGSRLLDKALGTRSPAKAFVNRFAGPTAPGPMAAPVVPGGPNPTGPRIRQQQPLGTPWGAPQPPQPAPQLPAAGPQHAAPYNGPPPVINQPAPAAQPQLTRGPQGPIAQPGPAPQLLLPPPRRSLASVLEAARTGPTINQPAPEAQRLLPAPRGIAMPAPEPQLALPPPRTVEPLPNQAPDVIPLPAPVKSVRVVKKAGKKVVTTTPAAAAAPAAEPARDMTTMMRQNLQNGGVPEGVTPSPEYLNAVRARTKIAAPAPIVAAPAPAPVAAPAPVVAPAPAVERAPTLSLQAREVLAREARAKEMADAHNERIRRERALAAERSSVRDPVPAPVAVTRAKAKATPEPVKVAAPAPVVRAEPAPTKGAIDTTIPDFLKRAPAKADTGTVVADLMKETGPAPSPHHKSGDEKATAHSASDDFLKSKGMSRDGQLPDWMKKSMSTIERIIGEKFATGRKIEKEVPGFNVDDFTTRYVHSRSVAGGEELKAYMKKQYPNHDDVFDRHLSDKTFSTVFRAKTSSKDGTRNKK